jgi:spore coat protein CotH
MWTVSLLLLASCGSGTNTSLQPQGSDSANSGNAVMSHAVIINEINYHDVSGSDSNDFIELLNTQDKEVNLAGWCIGGVNFCFDETARIAPRALAVVRGDEFGGRLSNNSETIELRNSSNEVVDAVTYGSTLPWPMRADGQGESLHRIVGSQPASSPDAWVSDVPSPGALYDQSLRTTPRGDSSVVINEIHYHPSDDRPEDEFIELLNVSASIQSLAGWCLSEQQMCFDSDVVLEPGELHVVRSFPSGELSNRRGVVRLTDPDGAVRDVVRYEDRGVWPAIADGHGYSLQRRDPLLFGYEPANWEAVVPTPGTDDRVRQSGYVPNFEVVEHTVHPTPEEEIVITARMRDGDALLLEYKIDFEKEVSVAMQRGGDDLWRGVIAPQAAGTLVRYRLVGTSVAGEGTWPRQGDGMNYHGTVVQSPTESELPRLQWFVTDKKYDEIYNDRDLYGDNGYPTVIAYNGEVFDNALMRIRGNQSRLNQKRKWKIVLPAGYSWDMGGLIETPVNEFALNSAVTDKSFVREILTSDLQKLSGGIGQQVFPLRFEKNNEFYGLYLYQEQPDGQWRDKYGFSNDAIAYKSDLRATLNQDQLSLSDRELRQRYQRKTQRYRNDVDEIRQLIRQVNNQNRAELISFAYRHIDIPQVIEAIATMRVAQHLEWEHKNHLLLYDPADEKWRLVPIDFDLNFGRRFVTGCNAFCEEVEASGYMEYMEANRLARIMLKVPEFRQMLDRRTKTLADAFLAEGKVEERIAELESLMRADAARDRKIWYTYGEQQSMQRGQEILINQYFVPKRKLFLGPESSRLPGSQRPEIAYQITEGETVRVSNSDTVAIDLSGVQITAINASIPAGTVLLPGQSVVLTPQRRARPADLQANDLHVWVRQS